MAELIAAEDAGDDALDFDVFGDDRLVGRVGGLQANALRCSIEALQRGFAVFEQGDDRFAVAR